MSKRSYGQFESLARALDLIGERWTLLLIRELMLGPRRYKDLLEGLPGIGTNLLAKRLQGLEAGGLVNKRQLPPPSSAIVYELTERGLQLEPALLELTRWGMESMDEPAAKDVLRPGWGVLAMRSTFKPEAAAGVHEIYEFRISGDVFQLRVNDGALETFQGAVGEPDLVISTDVETLMAMGARQLSPMEAAAAGKAIVQGSEEAANRSVEIFGFPKPRPEEQAGMAPGWGALAMRATFRPELARGVKETYQMDIDGEVFNVTVDDGTVRSSQGLAQDPAFSLKTDVRTFLALAAGQANPLDVVVSGVARVEGDIAAALRCIEIFGFSNREPESPSR
jgi:DNA-binding HxlR family transcriptional regulator/putative sterol carrier protein